MEWNPEDYARNSSAQLVWARELLARLSLKGAEIILDVGCGDGKVSAEFARAVPDGSVLAVDSSPAFIEYARRHYPPADYPNLQFECMDARRLQAWQRFDLIFSNAVLHWVDDPPAFLAGCRRLLAASGRLLFSCGGQGNAAGMVAVLEQIIRQPFWQPYFTGFAFPYYFYSPVEYGPWLATAGLRPVRMELVTKDMLHAGREGLAGWLRTTWMPYIRQVPGELQETFVLATADAYLARYPLDAQGRSHVGMVRLEVEAHLG